MQGSASRALAALAALEPHGAPAIPSPAGDGRARILVADEGADTLFASLVNYGLQENGDDL